ncbi:MAG TPA: hypothetical protein VGS62_05795 [Streptosporangiaceae bacterium]|nr:hypothetical protein [Streptosporangiaceae bacterium]
MAQFKLGKQPKKVDQRTLALARYLTPAAPPAPASVDYASSVTDWGMLGNDTVGDCAWAGQAHADMLWVANAQQKQLTITTAQVIHAYEVVTGYNPNDPQTDRGTALLDALNYWRHHGIDRQKITAFVEVDPKNTDHVKEALSLFGTLYVGVQLPDSVLPGGASSIPPWTVAPDGTPASEPNPNNGHCVIYGAYDANGLTAVTWGQTVPVSWAFHAAYCDELYAMLSPHWFSGGIDPQGIDIATLTADLQNLAGAGAAPAG